MENSELSAGDRPQHLLHLRGKDHRKGLKQCSNGRGQPPSVSELPLPFFPDAGLYHPNRPSEGEAVSPHKSL